MSHVYTCVPLSADAAYAAVLFVLTLLCLVGVLHP